MINKNEEEEGEGRQVYKERPETQMSEQDAEVTLDQTSGPHIGGY